MHELKAGLHANKFAAFWMLPKRFYRFIRFANDLYTLYNRLNFSKKHENM